MFARARSPRGGGSIGLVEDVVSYVLKLLRVGLDHLGRNLYDQQLRIEVILLSFPKFRILQRYGLTNFGIVRQHFQSQQAVELLSQSGVFPEIEVEHTGVTFE